MKISEYVFNEYREATTTYVSASQLLRELLPRFAELHKASKVPTNKATKELLRKLDKIENEIEAALVKIRSIRHTLLDLL